MYAKFTTPADRFNPVIVDRRELLRIKMAALAGEARVIKFYEQKSFGPLREEMHRHRIMELRREARATSMALGFIKGRSLQEMEVPGTERSQIEKLVFEGVLKRALEMVKKYGPANFVMATQPSEARAARQAKGKAKDEANRAERKEVLERTNQHYAQRPKATLLAG